MPIAKIDNQGKYVDFIHKYLDYNKKNDHFYNNLYLDENKFVIKIPLLEVQPSEEIKIGRFNLANNVFLTSY